MKKVVSMRLVSIFVGLLFLTNATKLRAQSTDTTQSLTSNGVNIYTMNASQLAQVPANVLAQGVQTLTQENSNQTVLYNQIKAFNQAMCTRMLQLNTQCPAQAYLIQPASDPLSCGQNLSSPSVFSVTASKLLGYRFRIQANTHYYSDEFGEGGGNIQFHRDDNQPVTAPRLRQITQMNLLSVTANSTITSAGYIKSLKTIAPNDLKSLVASMQLNITFNGQSITGDPSVKTLPLAAPTDPNVQSQVQIAPSLIEKMGKSPNCIISQSDLNQIMQSSQNSAGGNGP